MLKLIDFISYLKEQLNNHSIYVWGAQGEDSAIISEAWIRKMETSSDHARKAIEHGKNK